MHVICSPSLPTSRSSPCSLLKATNAASSNGWNRVRTTMDPSPDTSCTKAGQQGSTVGGALTSAGRGSIGKPMQAVLQHCCGLL